jgi:DNA-binding CsgD family transcriptional regulator
MIKVDDFLMPQEKDRVIPDEEHKVDILTRAFDAISRVTYRNLYIIDCFKMNFSYISNNPFFLCGHSREKIMKEGLSFYIKQIPENEQEMFVEINNAGFDFFYQAPKEERMYYTLSYDYNLLNGDNKMIVNQQITPLLMDGDGKLWLAACVVSMSTKKKTGNVIIQKTGQTSFWKYSFEKGSWEENNGVKLKEKEKMILDLSVKGYTMYAIAAKMNLSLDSIKLYRKKLFDRLGVKCITEALAYVVNNKLL